MIIEFTGAPCCGKSAISHGLAELFRTHGISVTEKPYILSHLASKRKRSVIKAVNVLRFAVTHPVISFRSLKYGPVRWWFNYIFISSCSEKKQICILEQGLCQCVSSLFDGKTASPKKIKKYFSELLPHDNDRWQIFVTAQAETIKNRISGRSDKPYYETTGNITDAIQKSVQTNEMLYEEWKSLYGSENCLIISNDKDDIINETAGKIYSELRLRGIV